MSSKNLIIQSISHANYIPLNKTLIKHLGIMTTVVLSNLIDKYIYFKNKYPDSVGFFLTHKHQCNTLNISEKRLIKFKRELISNGIISTKMKGLPAKEWYTIHFDKIAQLLDCVPTIDTISYLTEIDTKTLQKQTTLDPHILGGSYHIKEKQRYNTRKKKIFPEEISKKSPKVVKKVRTRKTNDRWKTIAIEKWNNLQGPSTHKKLNTKTIKKALDYLEWLTNGKFPTFCKLNPDFCKKQKIPSRIKYTQTQILETISLYQTLWQEGYWPEDKTKLPKSLNSFLFNPRTGTSFFLMLKHNSDMLKPIVDKSNTYTSPYLQHFDWNIDDDIKVKGDISSALDRLAKWVNHNFDQETLENHFIAPKGEKAGKFTPFFEKYSVWLTNCDFDHDWIVDNPKQVFNKWGEVFQDFLKYLEEKYYISLPIGR